MTSFGFSILFVLLISFPAVVFSNDLEVHSGGGPESARLIFYSQTDSLPEIESKLGEVTLQFPDEDLDNVELVSLSSVGSARKIEKFEFEDRFLSFDANCDCTAVIVDFGKNVFYLDFVPMEESAFVESGVGSGVFEGFDMLQGANRKRVEVDFPTIVSAGRLRGVDLSSVGQGVKNEREEALQQEQDVFNQSGTFGKYHFGEAISLAVSSGGLEKVSPLKGEVIAEASFMGGASNDVGLFDFMATRNSTSRFETQKFDVCPEGSFDDLFDFSGLNGGDFLSLAVHRSAAIDEEFKLHGSSVSNLVKFYIGAGFDVEANYYLKLMENDVQRNVLIEIMGLLDKGSLPASSLIKEMVPCSRLARVWSYWAGSFDDLVPDELNYSVVLFGGLPREMKKRLEPLVVRRFKESGFGQGAGFLDMKRNLDDAADDTALGDERGAIESSVPKSSDLLEAKLISGDGIGQLGSLSSDGNRLFLDGVIHSLGNDPIALALRKEMIESFLDEKNWPAAMSEVAEFLSVSPNDASNFVKENFPESFFGAMGDGDLLAMSYVPSFQDVLNLTDVGTRDGVGERLKSILEVVYKGADESALSGSESSAGEVDTTSPAQNEGAQNLKADPWSDYLEILDSSQKLRQEMVEGAK